MQILLALRPGIVVVHGIKAHEIEVQTVGHNVAPLHGTALLLTVKPLVGGIVGSEILVEADADGLVADDDALVESPYLRIDERHLGVGQQLLQIVESLAQLLIDVVHVGILRLHIHDDGLQQGILIEVEECRIDFGVVDLPELEHVFNECARLHGIIGVHLLQRREVARGEIAGLKPVVALHFHTIGSVVFHRLNLEVAARKSNNAEKKEIVYSVQYLSQ